METIADMQGERCQFCGKIYLTVYRIPDGIWEKIKPKGKTKGAGLACIECADMAAKLEGMSLYWEAADGHFPTEKAQAVVERVKTVRENANSCVVERLLLAEVKETYDYCLAPLEEK